MTNCPICNFNTDFLTSKKNRFKDQYDYLICKNCRLLFEKNLVLDSKKLGIQVSKIYQDDYFQKVDAGWVVRGNEFLRIIKKIVKIYGLIKNKKNISILDYGGGNGYLASKLAESYNVFYYDKYEKPTIEGKYKILNKPNRVDVIYAVELVEHVTDIKEWDFLKELSPDIFVFTTGLSDNIKKSDLKNWEYLNPDAGHMALYSTKSLYLLGRKYGFAYVFFPNISCHIFIKNKFLSKINFVKVEYFVYNILRGIKNLIK